MSHDISSFTSPSARSAPGLHLLEGGRGGPAVARSEYAPVVSRVVARRKSGLVFLDVADVWAFEADARLAFVHARSGRFDIDVSLADVEGCPFGPSFVRVHRSWLVNAAHVRELRVGQGLTELWVGDQVGEGAGGIVVPVARDLVRAVRERLLAPTIGLRRRDLDTR